MLPTSRATAVRWVAWSEWQIHGWVDRMALAGTFGQRVKRQLSLADAPPSLITRSRRGVDVAVTETLNSEPVEGLSGSLADDAYLVSLKLQDYPDCELWEHGKCFTKTDVRAGTTYLYDLRHDPRFVIDKPFHSVHFYLPRLMLDGIAREARTPPIGDLACRYGFGHDDEIMRHVGALMLEGLRRPAERPTSSSSTT
ncbi:hypothetical protein ACVWZ3_002326 [Bradyrhizobium sp. i1.3.6]